MGFQKEHVGQQEALGRLDRAEPVMRRLEPEHVRRLCDDDDRCRWSLEELASQGCEDMERRLIGTDHGIAVEIEDCRPFATRAPQLHSALQEAALQEAARGMGYEEKALDDLVLVQNLFGVRHRVSLATTLGLVTGHLHAFFDGYMVVDGGGRTIYEGSGDVEMFLDPRLSVRHRQTPPFASLVDLSKLLEAEDARGWLAGAGGAAASDGGLSVVKRVEIGDVAVRVFVHPFTLERTRPLDGAAATTPSTYYLVGVVDEDGLRSEALRLRPGHMSATILVIVALVLLLPVVWLASVGDRLVLGPYRLLATAVAGAFALVLVATAGVRWIADHRDESVLDAVVEEVARQIRAGFHQDLREKLRSLLDVTKELPGPAQPEEVAEADQSVGLTNDRSSARRLAERIADRFYCGGSDLGMGSEVAASQRYGKGTWLPGLPQLDVAFRMNEGGRQTACVDWRRVGTKKLNLSFREYFRMPSAAAVWWFEDASKDFRCERRLPFFVERIYSVVRNTKTTVVSVPADHPCRGTDGQNGAGDVFAAVARFPSLEDVILPPGFHFAVVDGNDGRTLFDSDPDRAMVANFADDVGRDEDFMAAVRFGPDELADRQRDGKRPDPRAREIVDVKLNGVPVRARVEPLGYGTPWRLVVYRDHELADSIAWQAAWEGAGLICLFLLIAASAAGILGRAAIGPDFVTRIVGVACSGTGPLATVLFAVLLAALTTAGFVYPALFLGAVLLYYLWTRGVACSEWPEVEEAVSRWRVGMVAAALAVLAVGPVRVVVEHRTVEYAREAAAPLSAAVERQVEERLEKYRRLAERYADDDRDRWAGFQRPHDWWVDDLLRPARVRTSGEEGGRNRISREDVVAYPEAIRHAIRASEFDVPELRRGMAWRIAVVAAALGVLIALIAWTLARLIAPAGDAARLPRWAPHGRAEGGSVRVVLVCASAADVKAGRNSVEQLFASSRAAVRDPNGWRWCGDAQATVSIVEDFDAARELQSVDLLAMLEAAVSDGNSVLLCARSVPSYQLAELALLAPGRSPQLRERWVQVLAGFETCVGNVGDARDTLPDDGGRVPKRTVEALRAEARANPDLAESAAAVCESLMAEASPADPSAALSALRHRAEGYFARQWAVSMLDERLQLYALARHGFANATQREALASLANRGLIRGFGEGGRIRLASRAFGDYVRSLTHDDLLAWGREGHRNSWRAIWPLVGTIAVLAVVFFLRSSPQTIGIVVAALSAVAGAAPLRALVFGRSGGGGGDS